MIGSVVRVSSGGPEMIVVDVLPDLSMVVCAWRDGGGYREELFYRWTLEEIAER